MTEAKSRGLDIDARLRITAEEAAAGVRRDVKVMRFIRCRDCPAGSIDPKCASCSGEGLTTSEEKLKVTVPAGIKAGTKLRLAGKGHESAERPTGDCYLEIELPPPPKSAPPPKSPALDTKKPSTPKPVAASEPPAEPVIQRALKWRPPRDILIASCILVVVLLAFAVYAYAP